jgi:hypothetical protein
MVYAEQGHLTWQMTKHLSGERLMMKVDISDFPASPCINGGWQVAMISGSVLPVPRIGYIPVTILAFQ